MPFLLFIYYPVSGTSDPPNIFWHFFVMCLEVGISILGFRESHLCYPICAASWFYVQVIPYMI